MVMLEEKIRNLKGQRKQTKKDAEKDIETQEKQLADCRKYHAIVSKGNRTEEGKHRREIADAKTRLAQLQENGKP